MPTWNPDGLLYWQWGNRIVWLLQCQLSIAEGHGQIGFYRNMPKRNRARIVSNIFSAYTAFQGNFFQILTINTQEHAKKLHQALKWHWRFNSNGMSRYGFQCFFLNDLVRYRTYLQAFWQWTMNSSFPGLSWVVIRCSKGKNQIFQQFFSLYTCNQYLSQIVLTALL